MDMQGRDTGRQRDAGSRIQGIMISAFKHARHRTESPAVAGEGSLLNIKMLLLAVFVFSGPFFHQASGQLLDLLTIPPDMDRMTHQYIESRGFQYEFYSVPTRDGYYIGLYRIVHPLLPVTRYPVLFATVGGGYSEEWLRNSEGGNVDEPLDVVGPNIGFEVAKRGYDVWLLDWRGVPYDSYIHVNYTMNDIEYYDFSFDDLALFDLAAGIDFVRGVSGQNKIAYVGLLESATTYLMLASALPRFNEIVQPFIALSPAWDQSYSNPLNKTGRAGVQKDVADQVKKRGPVNPPIEYMTYVSLCQLVIVQRALCNPIAYYILKRTFTDGKVGSVNYDRLSVYLFATVNPGSQWEGAQLEEFQYNRRLKMLNTTQEENKKRYGGDPPEYMPERITNPEMHFLTGKSQSAFTANDLINFEKRLGTKLRSKPDIPQSVPWSAMSFQDGEPDDVVKYVNTPVLDILASYD